jgi:hypothetical protein
MFENCGNCHNALCAVVGQRAAGHWNAVKTNHRDRLSGLSDADSNTLYDYLMTNFNDKKPEPNLTAEQRKTASCDVGF